MRGSFTEKDKETLWNYIEDIESRNITVKEVAEKMKKNTDTVWYHYHKLGGTPIGELDAKPEYAFYKGDELVIIGTVDEIAEKLNIKTRSVRWYSTPSARKRSKRTLVRL